MHRELVHDPSLAPSLRLLGAAAPDVSRAAVERDSRHHGGRHPRSNGDGVSRRRAHLPGYQDAIGQVRHRAGWTGSRQGRPRWHHVAQLSAIRHRRIRRAAAGRHRRQCESELHRTRAVERRQRLRDARPAHARSPGAAGVGRAGADRHRMRHRHLPRRVLGRARGAAARRRHGQPGEPARRSRRIRRAAADHHRAG